MTTDNWERPGFVMALKWPNLLDEWRARVATWEAENPEMAKSWNAALDERDARIAAIELAEEEKRARARLRHAAIDAGISSRILEFLDLARDKREKTEALAAAELFAESEQTFLLLTGAPGCGKSVAAASVLLGRISTNPGRHTGLFMRAVESSRFSSYDQEDKELFSEMKRCRLLVLDDLGAESLHDAWRPLLDELIDVRYGEKRKTIITTNLDSKGFRARYGERIADRIRHDGIVKNCGGLTLRKRVGAE